MFALPIIVGRFLHRHLFTILVVCLVLGYLLYQRLPLYLADRELIGGQAADFRLASLEAQELQLSELKGQKVLLNFFATWCAPCIREVPDLIALTQELKGKDFQIVSISNEDIPTLKGFKKQYAINYPILPDPDGSVHRLYNADVIPTLIWIDEEGQVEDISHGEKMFLRSAIRYWVSGNLWER